MRTVISAIVRHSTMLWMPLVCLMSNALLKMPSSPRPSNITRPRCRVWTSTTQDPWMAWLASCPDASRASVMLWIIYAQGILSQDGN
ncbi:hypothetical protein BS78_06G035000 [Paspalum vaginatum]|nr:hypothetical protein BS78_06G035000 [Paspalum vaginatum]